MPASASSSLAKEEEDGSAATNVSTPAFCFAAKSRTSWVIFIEQNLGPHIEQKWAVLAPSAGRVWSWYCSAVSGSRLGLNWSRQRNSERARLSASSRTLAAGGPLARSAAWAASL